MAQYAQNPEQFTQEVLNFDGVALVDFYADRCGPCRMLSPIIDELTQAYESNNKVKIIKVNVDENPDTAWQYGIMSIPAVLTFKWGELKYNDVGVQMKEVYENKINMLLE
jgi:thioredoxin 1